MLFPQAQHGDRQCPEPRKNRRIGVTGERLTASEQVKDPPGAGWLLPPISGGLALVSELEP